MNQYLYHEQEVPFTCAIIKSYASSPILFPIILPAATASGKCTPPQIRDYPQSLLKSVHVLNSMKVLNGGVNPGSLVDAPFTYGIM